jgi:hypothetical protein
MSLWSERPFDGEAQEIKDNFEETISAMSGKGLRAIARWADDVH